MEAAAGAALCAGLCCLLLPTLTLSTALVRTMPLLRVMGCWLCSRWSMSSGMVGKPSPSSLYRFCREGRLRGHLCVPTRWDACMGNCTHGVCECVGCMHEIAHAHMAQACVRMHDAGLHPVLQVWSMQGHIQSHSHKHTSHALTPGSLPVAAYPGQSSGTCPLPGLPRCHGHSRQQPG